MFVPGRRKEPGEFKNQSPLAPSQDQYTAPRHPAVTYFVCLCKRGASVCVVGGREGLSLQF